MRPYILKKDDPKALHDNPTTGIQPSHLALLEATCSKIGDTFQDSCHPVFTQKNLTNYIDKKTLDNDSIRSCVFSSITLPISQTTNCFNQRTPSIAALELQHNQPIFASHQQTTPPLQHPSSCLKIKSEANNNTLDYNQNYTDGMHVCPNIITDTRLLESQARASFNRACCHENQSPSCNHQTNTLEASNLTVMNQPPPCQHENTSSLSHVPSSPSSSTSSCLFQSSPSGSSQSPSCAMTTLTHLPISTSNNNNNNNMFCENASRQKTTPSINPWQNQSVHRQGQEPTPNSSCILHDNFGPSPPTPGLPSSPQERGFRTYSPHNPHDRQFSTNFRSPEYGSVAVESHHPSSHYVGSQPIHSPHQQSSFDSYSSPGAFENNMDVKPDPYALHQQTLRTGHTSMIPGNYDHHSQNMNNLQNTPDSMNLPPPSHYLTHNHPPPGLSYGNPGYPGNFPMHQNPDLVPGTPMGGPPEMVPQNYVDYQYQQQMFYSRENRRPRRIACTCPNCRDGENKTVTTKDGKQRKLHICHIPGCGKEYGKTSHLRAHLRWHAGERPFACNWLFCNKRFTRSDELQRHRRTHTGDKRFECSTCLKKFMRSDHLSKHMKTHQSQNKQGKEKGSDNQSNTVDKNKTIVSKNTQQQKQQSQPQQNSSDKSKMTSLGLPESMNL